MVTLAELLKKLDDSWNKFTDWISTGLNDVYSFFMPWLDMLQSLIDGVFDELRSAFEETWNLAQSAYDDAAKALDAAVTAVSDSWGDIVAVVDSVVVGATSTLEVLIDAAETTAKDYADSLVSGFNDYLAAVEDNATQAQLDAQAASDSLNQFIVNFDIFVQDSFTFILDQLIETPEEVELLKKRPVS